MTDKKKCQKLYRELKADMPDLDSVNFRSLWFSRLNLLKESGCWWHYSVLLRKGRDYLKGKGDNPSSWYSLRDKGV